MEMQTAQFAPGQVVKHVRYGYKGIIYDVDAVYSQPAEWYALMSGDRPSRNKPWYHVLVDGESHSTYVAEEYLVVSSKDENVEHPLKAQLFNEAGDGHLSIRTPMN